ncbi:MAG: hypothetical protein MJ070_10290 [Lachnospiraceae bacterium]|nr:hypothetical protein [Lachnospiraceae bacterium]
MVLGMCFEKWKVAVIVFLLCVLSLSSSCGKTEDHIYVLPENVLSNYYEASDTFSFNVLYLYSGAFPEIELISLNSENDTVCWTEFSNNECDEFEAYNGYRMGYIKLKVPCFDSVSVYKATFLINDNTEEISFRQPYRANKHIPNPFPDFIGVTGHGTPFQIFYRGDCVNDVPFGFLARADILVSSFSFSDYLNIEKASVLIDDEYIGDYRDVFPLKVNEGSSFKILIEKGNFENSYADYAISYILKYSLVNEPDKMLELFDTTYFLGITDQAVFEEFVSLWEQNNQ